MNWTEIKPPKKGFSLYSHTSLLTPIGTYVIEWSDKEYYVTLNGEYVDSETALFAAKELVVEHLEMKYSELSKFLGSC